MFAALLQKLGIAEEVNRKAVLGKRGYEVAQAVADGRAEIGTTFISEILTVQGVTVVGPLPGALHNANTYTAAIPKERRAAGSGQGAPARAHRSGLARPLDRGRAGAGLRLIRGLPEAVPSCGPVASCLPTADGSERRWTR